MKWKVLRYIWTNPKWSYIPNAQREPRKSMITRGYRQEIIDRNPKNCVTVFAERNSAPLYMSCKNSQPQPIALQHISNWSIFVLFGSAGKTFVTTFMYLCVLATIYKFHWTSKVLYATLTIWNRFLGVQIFAVSKKMDYAQTIRMTSEGRRWTSCTALPKDSRHSKMQIMYDDKTCRWLL